MFEAFGRLAPEVRAMTWGHALLIPGVHFIKPNGSYNGSFLLPAGDDMEGTQGPGVSEVSSMSAACEHARLSRTSLEAKEAVDKMMSARGMARIILSSRMIRANLDSIPGSNALASALDRSHIIVDKENDLFCLSSFFNNWFPNYFFSGGIASEHSALADIKLLAISMPPCNRPRHYFKCRDCRDDFASDPDKFCGHVEICRRCIASWICNLEQLERVYLIVPGLPRAETGNLDLVYRWGEPATIEAAIKALPKRALVHQTRDEKVLPATGTRPAITFHSTHTLTHFGPEGPQCFYGCGITLFEVAAEKLPADADEIMQDLVEDALEMRQESVEAGHTSSPYPSNPKHCGGNVEFRFLSY